jgi:hypothetical protein
MEREGQPGGASDHGGSTDASEEVACEGTRGGIVTERQVGGGLARSARTSFFETVEVARGRCPKRDRNG